VCAKCGTAAITSMANYCRKCRAPLRHYSFSYAAIEELEPEPEREFCEGCRLPAYLCACVPTVSNGTAKPADATTEGDER